MFDSCLIGDQRKMKPHKNSCAVMEDNTHISKRKMSLQRPTIAEREIGKKYFSDCEEAFAHTDGNVINYLEDHHDITKVLESPKKLSQWKDTVEHAKKNSRLHPQLERLYDAGKYAEALEFTQAVHDKQRNFNNNYPPKVYGPRSFAGCGTKTRFEPREVSETRKKTYEKVLGEQRSQALRLGIGSVIGAAVLSGLAFAASRYEWETVFTKRIVLAFTIITAIVVAVIAAMGFYHYFILGRTKRALPFDFAHTDYPWHQREPFGLWWEAMANGKED